MAYKLDFFAFICFYDGLYFRRGDYLTNWQAQQFILETHDVLP